MASTDILEGPSASQSSPPRRSDRIWRVLTLHGRVGRRAAVVLWTAVVVALALFTGWRWIVAAGFASLVLSLLPCAAMCAIGLCSGSGRNCRDQATTATSQDAKP